MTPSTVAAMRVLLGFVVLAAVLRLRGLRMPTGLAWWRHFAVVAVSGSVIPFTLLAWGEQHVSSALTSVLNASTPLFAAVFVAAFLGERLRPLQIGGLLLGFVGVAFLDEPFELRLLFGGGLTVVGIILLNGRPLRRPPAPTPAPVTGH